MIGMTTYRFFLSSFGFTTIVLSSLTQAAHAQIYIPVPVYDYYGSFAYSKSTRQLGISWNYRTSQSAERRAVEVCTQTGASDCASLGWFANTCAAFALDSNGIAGVGTNRVREVAKQEALSDCSKLGGEGCEIIEAVCSL